MNIYGFGHLKDKITNAFNKYSFQSKWGKPSNLPPLSSYVLSWLFNRKLGFDDSELYTEDRATSPSSWTVETNAVQGNGTSSGIDFGKTLLAGAATFDFRIKFETSSDITTQQQLAGERYTNNAQFYISGGSLYYRFTIGGVSELHIQAGLAINTTYEARVTYDGSNMKSYLDGVLVDTEVASGTVDVTDGHFALMCAVRASDGNKTKFFNGVMYDVLLIVDGTTVLHTPLNDGADSDAELLTDGDMEAAGTSAWTAVDATLSKVPSTLSGSTQALRLTATGATFYAGQTVSMLGNPCRATGYYRTDGTANGAVYGNTPVVLSNPTDWTYFDVIVDGNVVMYVGSLDASGWVEFDNVSITDATVSSFADISGNNNTGTGTDVAATVYDRVTTNTEVNSGLVLYPQGVFNGTSAYVTLTSAVNLDYTKDFTTRHYWAVDGNGTDRCLVGVSTEGADYFLQTDSTNNLLKMYDHTLAASKSTVFDNAFVEGDLYLLETSYSKTTRIWTVTKTSITTGDVDIKTADLSTYNFSFALDKIGIRGSVNRFFAGGVFEFSITVDGVTQIDLAFDEGSGSTVADSSGNGNDGTGTNLAWGIYNLWQDNEAGRIVESNCVEGNGSDAKVDFGTVNLMGTGSQNVIFEFNAINVPAGLEYAMSEYIASGNKRGWALRYSTSTINITVGKADGTYLGSFSLAALTIAEGDRIKAIFSAGAIDGNVAIYINDVFQDNLVITGQNILYSNSAPLTYFNYNASTYGDIGMFNVKITVDDVIKLQTPCSEGSGTTVHDISGNSNHGTGTNLTWSTQDEFHYNLMEGDTPAGAGNASTTEVDYGVVSVCGSGTEDFEWEGCINTNGSGVGDVIASEYQTTGDKRGWGIRVAANQFSLQLGKSDGTFRGEYILAYTGAGSFIGNAKVTFKSGIIKLYINDVEEASASSASVQTSIYSNGANLRNFCFYVSGSISNPYAGTLHSETITVGGTIVAQHNYKEGRGSTVKDEFGNDGTASDLGWLFIPALLDGSAAAADGNAITNPSGYWHNGAESKVCIGALEHDGTGYPCIQSVKDNDPSEIFHSASTGYCIPKSYDDIEAVFDTLGGIPTYAFCNTQTAYQYKDLLIYIQGSEPTLGNSVKLAKFIEIDDYLVVDDSGQQTFDDNDQAIVAI